MDVGYHLPNRVLAAVGLILLAAFALCSALALQHSKLVRRYGLTTVAVARQLFLRRRGIQGVGALTLYWRED